MHKPIFVFIDSDDGMKEVMPTHDVYYIGDDKSIARRVGVTGYKLRDAGQCMSDILDKCDGSLYPDAKMPLLPDISVKPSKRVNVGSFLKGVEELVMSSKRNRRTVGDLLDIWTNNAIRNMVYYHTRAKPIFGSATDRSCVLLGAGPSVDEFIDLIPRLRDNYDILCVDTALNILNDVGVRPDYVFSLDGSAAKLNMMRNCDTAESTLVMCPTISRELADLFSSHMCVTYGLPFQYYVDQYAGDAGLIGVSGSVGTLMLETANKLGYSSIILAGMDMTILGVKQYASSVIDRRYKPCTKFDTLESMMAFELREHHKTQIPNNMGGMSTTTLTMAQWAKWVNNRVSNMGMSGKRIYNISSTGSAAGQYVEHGDIFNMAKANGDKLVVKSAVVDRSIIKHAMDLLHMDIMGDPGKLSFKWHHILNMPIDYDVYADRLAATLNEMQ